MKIVDNIVDIYWLAKVWYQNMHKYLGETSFISQN